MKMVNCVFCKISKGETPCNKVYEDEHAFAFLDADPANVGHTLVIPKKHFETIEEMKKDDFDRLSETILKVGKGIMKISDGMNILQNNKKYAGQVVPHVHFHLIPRFKGDGYLFEWNKDHKITEEENDEFLKKIKSFLK